MGGKRLPRAPSKPIQIVEEYVLISEEEDNERIERLTRQILRIVRDMEKTGKRPGRDSAQGEGNGTVEEIFGGSFEKSLGI